MRNGIKALAILAPVLALISVLFWYQRARDHRIEAEQANGVWAARLELAKKYIDSAVKDGDARGRAIAMADKAHQIVREQTIKGCLSPETWPPPEEAAYREQLFREMQKLARAEGRTSDAAQFQRLAAVAARGRSTGLAGLDELNRQISGLKLDLSDLSTTKPATERGEGPRD